MGKKIHWLVASCLMTLSLVMAACSPAAEQKTTPITKIETEIIKREVPMTFEQMVSAAMASVTALKPAEAQRRLKQDPNTLIIDVRDAADIALTGRIPGAVNISYGSLTYKADQGVPPEWRDPRVQDRSRPIITNCTVGPLGALGAKLLKDMGFTNVAFVEGGIQGWKDAGLPTEAP